MTKATVRITLTIDQAVEVKKAITTTRDLLVRGTELHEATQEERDEYQRRVAHLSDVLMQL